jgi:hypothetical protein
VIVVPGESNRVFADAFGGKRLGGGFEHGQHAGLKFGRLAGFAARLLAFFVAHRAGAGVPKEYKAIVRHMAVFPIDIDTGTGGQIHFHRLGIRGCGGGLKRGLHEFSIAQPLSSGGSRYLAVDVVAELAFGVVTIPTAKPPTAPATIPMRARTNALSIKLDFPRLDIHPPIATMLVYMGGRTQRNWRGADKFGRIRVSATSSERIDQQSWHKNVISAARSRNLGTASATHITSPSDAGTSTCVRCMLA